MNCTECGNPVRAKGLCNAHYQRQLKRNKSRRIEKATSDERRHFLNAYRGAENALKQLAKQNTDTDYSGALLQCRERIAALERCQREAGA